MRLIGTLAHENEAHRLVAYLKRKGIESTTDVAFDPQSGQMAYQLWVHDEDRMNEAIAAFEEFQKRPSDAAFDPPIVSTLPSEDPPEIPPPLRRPRTPLTTFFLSLCALIFVINKLQEWPLRTEGLSEDTFLLTPIQALLLFDLPPIFEALEAFVEKHQIKSDQKLEDLSPQVKEELKAIEKIPFWRGVYDWVLLKSQGKDTSIAEGPLFLRIREGEIWRLFSPAVLHRDLLHILFNMIWLWVLGRPIEQRIGFFKTLLLTLVAGIGSNVAQYFMSGPFFLGYSGIVMGLAGFTWMREKLAPWEGYPLQRSTVVFLLLFIGGMFAIQFTSFLLQLIADISFAPNIANTAHIAGALFGVGLARLPYFAWRTK